MAKYVSYNASVVLNSVDLSDHVESISFTVNLADQPGAGMGEAEDYSLPGTRMVSPITLNMFQDFASSKVYATLMTLWTNRTTFNAVIKADSGANAATNPQFTVSVFIKTFPVLDVQRNQRHMSQIVLQPAGALSIATS